MPASVAVHPVVLLNIVDHITRVRLQHQPQRQPSSPRHSAAEPFLSSVGVLMGTTSACGPGEAGAGGAAVDGVSATTVSTSFELPPRAQPHGTLATVPMPVAGDDAFLQRRLRDEVDWAATWQHCERLGAVMPEMTAVGYYIVCAGPPPERCVGGGGGGGAAAEAQTSPGEGAVKKIRGESSGVVGGVEAVARLLLLLRRCRDDATQAPRSFLLLVWYDAAVPRCGSAATSPAAARLPFECFTVHAAAADGAALTPSASTVAPADMEWIALATETAVVGPPDSCPSAAAAVASPPLPPPPSASPTRPGLLRRLYSGANIAATAAAAAAAAAAASEPAPPPAMPVTGTSATSSSSQACRAAGELVGSLRLVARMLDTTASNTVSAEDVELLRGVATCLGGVPEARPSNSAVHASDSTAESADEVLAAALALEAHCAVRLRALGTAQQQLLSHRRFTASLTSTRRTSSRPAKVSGSPLPSPATAAAAADAERWSHRRHGDSATVKRELVGHIWR
ncbi:hypothetical protein NESM_000569300 [Novymonas esmeraldas]|uniref:Uncharacterized protein n=1 Tax=Novymonas esmeraldas TaxID=1808958 RepID=A0AAW0ET47_9TRYP